MSPKRNATILAPTAGVIQYAGPSMRLLTTLALYIADTL
jgi:hypothetical protein